MTTDRLALAHVIEDAGIERNKAEAVANAVFDAIHDNVATKADIAAARGDLGEFGAAMKADISAVRGDLGELRLATRAGIAAMHAELRGEITEVRAELRGEVAALREVELRLGNQIDQMVGRIGTLVVVRLGLLVVVVAGLLFAALLFAALHYWPPGHG